MRCFSLVTLLCGSEEQKILECSLSDSWKSKILLCRFIRRCHQSWTIFYKRKMGKGETLKALAAKTTWRLTTNQVILDVTILKESNDRRVGE